MNRPSAPRQGLPGVSLHTNVYQKNVPVTFSDLIFLKLWLVGVPQTVLKRNRGQSPSENYPCAPQTCFHHLLLTVWANLVGFEISGIRQNVWLNLWTLSGSVNKYTHHFINYCFSVHCPEVGSHTNSAVVLLRMEDGSDNPCLECLFSFLTESNFFILSRNVDYTEFSAVSLTPGLLRRLPAD